MARIEIDPDLWRRTRTLAFEEGTTATELVNEALRLLHKSRAAKPRTNNSVEAPRSANPPQEDSQEDPWKALAEAKQGEVMVGRPIQTPEEAAKVAATIPSFHPVPKPSSKPRSRRSTGKSS